FFGNSARCAPKKSNQQGNIMDMELVVLRSIRDRLVALLDIVSEDSVTSSSEIEGSDEDAHQRVVVVADWDQRLLFK
ncbi:hypothetical protein BGZ65_002509, partial [Modicella reniformis]